MTLHATRDGEKITIHANTDIDADVRDSRVQEVRVTGHVQHLRYFHSQLGRLIEEADAAVHPGQESERKVTGHPHG